MIIGIGVDICNIVRIEKSLAKFGKRFEERVFTLKERDRANKSSNPAAIYAKRFAAKEAFVKAVGKDGSGGLCWQDIEIINHNTGHPHISLSENAHNKLKKLIPDGYKPYVFLTMSDDYPSAIAFVTIEARFHGNDVV